jgi:serine/threonine protein kinase
MPVSTDTQVLPFRFGELAKEMGLINDQQLAAALEKQRALRASGGKSRLGEVLILMNVLAVEQVKRVLSEQRKKRAAQADKALPMEFFGEYKLLEKLGEGGMGAVYKARETLADRIVALKVLRKNLAGNAGFAERFTREAKLAGSLQHPNIVACHNTGVERGVQFIVMEFVEGETMKTRLKNAGGKLPEREVLKLIREIAAGLGHAHERGIVHRDVKPDNVLLGKDGSVKVSDFGTAKSFLDEESLTQSGIIIGTPHYISPEQVRADKVIDHRADLYALGGTMYHALTGHVPFDAPTALDIMRRHLHDELDSPADLTPGLSMGTLQIVTKLMAKLPSQRYQSADELIEDIDQVLKDQVPRVATRDQYESSIRPPRKKVKKAKAGCMGVLIIGLCAGVCTYFHLS